MQRIICDFWISPEVNQGSTWHSANQSHYPIQQLKRYKPCTQSAFILPVRSLFGTNACIEAKSRKLNNLLHVQYTTKSGNTQTMLDFHRSCAKITHICFAPSNFNSVCETERGIYRHPHWFKTIVYHVHGTYNTNLGTVWWIIYFCLPKICSFVKRTPLWWQASMRNTLLSPIWYRKLDT